MMTIEESQELLEKHQKALLILGEIRALHIKNMILKVKGDLEAFNVNIKTINDLEYSYDNLICELADVEYKVNKMESYE